VLGLSQSTAIVVGTIIGSGIFLVPQEMMRAVGHSSLVYLAWIAGGLLSLFGAMTYAELAARMPEAGGEYVYIRRAYGDLPAFLYMWTWFAVAKPASIASVTTGLARVMGVYSPVVSRGRVAARTVDRHVQIPQDFRRPEVQAVDEGTDWMPVGRGIHGDGRRQRRGHEQMGAYHRARPEHRRQ